MMRLMMRLRRKAGIVRRLLDLVQSYIDGELRTRPRATAPSLFSNVSALRREAETYERIQGHRRRTRRRSLWID